MAHTRTGAKSTASMQSTKIDTQINHNSGRDAIIAELIQAYGMELETVLNYIAHSTNLDGINAEEVREALKDDVKAEVGHAQALAMRIKILGGLVPGSKSLTMNQDTLQPTPKTTDVETVIRGVIAAEDAACEQYNKIIMMCDGVDFVTQDVCIELLKDEEEHRREFIGYLKHFEEK
jgi:bacterioferritin